jgi:hypothetical protein
LNFSVFNRMTNNLKSRRKGYGLNITQAKDEAR